MATPKTPRPGAKTVILPEHSSVRGAEGISSHAPIIAIAPEAQDRIGHQLRSVYNEVLAEPVPDRFLQLLAALERKEAGES
jgi:hypothetical protein